MYYIVYVCVYVVEIGGTEFYVESEIRNQSIKLCAVINIIFNVDDSQYQK